MTLVSSLKLQFDLKFSLEAESMNKKIGRWSVYDERYSLVKYEKNEVIEVERLN